MFSLWQSFKSHRELSNCNRRALGRLYNISFKSHRELSNTECSGLFVSKLKSVSNPIGSFQTTKTLRNLHKTSCFKSHRELSNNRSQRVSPKGKKSFKSHRELSNMMEV